MLAAKCARCYTAKLQPRQGNNIRKLSAPFIYLSAMFMLGLTAKIAFTTYVIYRVDVVGMDPLQLVLAGTALELSVFLFEIPTGVVADIYSRRLSTQIGFVLSGLGILLEGLSPTVGTVLLAQAMWGFGWTFVSGAFSAWITDETSPEEVGQLFIRGRQLSLIGNLVGIPIAVFLSRGNLAWPFLVGGGLRILFAIFLLLYMPERGFKRTPPEEREGWRSLVKTFSEGVRLVRGRQVLIIFTAITFLVGFYSEAWDRLSQPYLLEAFRFPSLGNLNLDAITWFGILNVGFILVGILANEVAKRRVDTRQNMHLTRALQLIYAVMVICILAFLLVRSFYLAMLAILIFYAVREVSYPLIEAWLNKHLSSRLRATVLSMAGQLDAFGEIASGPVMGYVGRIFSIRTAIFFSALTLAPVIPLYERIRGIQHGE